MQVETRQAVAERHEAVRCRSLYRLSCKVKPNVKVRLYDVNAAVWRHIRSWARRLNVPDPAAFYLSAQRVTLHIRWPVDLCYLKHLARWRTRRERTGEEKRAEESISHGADYGVEGKGEWGKVREEGTFSGSLLRYRSPKPEARSPKPEAPKPEARSPKPEARSPKPEARSPKPEARSPKPEARNRSKALVTRSPCRC